MQKRNQKSMKNQIRAKANSKPIDPWKETIEMIGLLALYQAFREKYVRERMEEVRLAA